MLLAGLARERLGVVRDGREGPCPCVRRRLAAKARSVVRDLDPQNDLTFLRTWPPALRQTWQGAMGHDHGVVSVASIGERRAFDHRRPPPPVRRRPPPPPHGDRRLPLPPRQWVAAMG